MPIEVLYAPIRSGVSSEDFRLTSLVGAIGRARFNLVIAEDVGMVKTIEAALAIEEMLVRTVLVPYRPSVLSHCHRYLRHILERRHH
jgi:hypothetical protein